MRCLLRFASVVCLTYSLLVYAQSSPPPAEQKHDSAQDAFSSARNTVQDLTPQQKEALERLRKAPEKFRKKYE